MTYEESESPFFSPRSDNEVISFDYRKQLVLMGAKLPPSFTWQVKKLMHNDELIYQTPAMPRLEAHDPKDLSEVCNIKVTHFSPSEIEAFKFITMDVEGESGLPELAFGITMRSGDVVFLGESDCVRIFSNTQYVHENKTTFSFKSVLSMLAERSLYKFETTGVWPNRINSPMQEYFKNRREISPGVAMTMACDIAELNGIPYMERGSVIQPKRREIHIPDLPELNTPLIMEESRKLNPTFGALSLLRGSK